MLYCVSYIHHDFVITEAPAEKKQTVWYQNLFD